MNFEITKGKIKKPYKVVVYGPEGIGKSTFASHFPDPLFIDTEGSTRSLDIGGYKMFLLWLLSICLHGLGRFRRADGTPCRRDCN